LKRKELVSLEFKKEQKSVEECEKKGDSRHKWRQLKVERVAGWEGIHPHHSARISKERTCEICNS
jgi:hypothetical protein